MLVDAVLGVHIATLPVILICFSVAFSPNGTHIATLMALGQSPQSFSPDSLWLASGSSDHTLCLLGSKSRHTITTPIGHFMD
ncbi:hypothetical protein BS47DRAFT_1397037 [Hydnum rufescens UP504]|uniref:Uncharacterized protein n=1 Tax=Hydnum rufescens UP504 TaxID=1448309 RepID=A0A9P6ANW2_9AGAM|nr:hypothetical protein BS47DRAFT_1397037 [Hydnum rufescens UP504]